MNTAARTLSFTSSASNGRRKLSIQRNVPMPSVGPSIMQQIRDMPVGASFFTTRNGDLSAAYSLNQCACRTNKGPRYTCKGAYEKGSKGSRVWRIK